MRLGHRGFDLLGYYVCQEGCMQPDFLGVRLTLQEFRFILRPLWTVPGQVHQIINAIPSVQPVQDIPLFREARNLQHSNAFG